MEPSEKNTSQKTNTNPKKEEFGTSFIGFPDTFVNKLKGGGSDKIDLRKLRQPSWKKFPNPQW